MRPSSRQSASVARAWASDGEQGVIQQFVAQTSVEVFDKGMPWVGLPKTMSCQSILRLSAKARIAFEVDLVLLSLKIIAGFPRRSMIAADFCANPDAGQGCVSHERQALADEVVDHSRFAELPPIRQLVRNKIPRSLLIEDRFHQHRGTRAPVARCGRQSRRRRCPARQVCTRDAAVVLRPKAPGH